LPPKGVTLTVSKPGYAASQKSASVQPGERLEIALARRAILTVTAISDEYGVRAGVPGVAVSVDGRPLGKTDERGVYNYTYEGAPTDLAREVKRLKARIDKIATKGWHGTPLRRTVDMVVLGSVARDDKGLIIETKFYMASGSLVLSQIARARDEGAINGAVREVVANVMERFPFEGTVVAVDGERYQLNLGKPYRVGRGTEFALLAAEAVTGDSTPARSRQFGLLRVNRAEEGGSWAELETINARRTVTPGDRVVRRGHLAGDGEDSGTSVTLSAKGGLAPDVT